MVSTEIHGKEHPNQLPLSVSFPRATPARRVGSFRGCLFVMIFLPLTVSSSSVLAFTPVSRVRCHIGSFEAGTVHSFPSPQELLRPASWPALLSRTFTFELVPTRSPSISVEYDYVDKQSIPTAGLSPASPTALWAAGHRIFPGKNDELILDFRTHRQPRSGCWRRATIWTAAMCCQACA